MWTVEPMAPGDQWRMDSFYEIFYPTLLPHWKIMGAEGLELAFLTSYEK